MSAYGRPFSCRTALFLFSPPLSSVESVDLGALSSLLSPPAPSTRPVLLSSLLPVRVASRPRPCPTPPTEEGGEAAIGRENRGIRRGDAIGRRWLTGPRTPPRGNSPRSFLLFRQGQPYCCYYCLHLRHNASFMFIFPNWFCVKNTIIKCNFYSLTPISKASAPSGRDAANYTQK